MEIEICGAAKTVTGSQHIIRACGKTLLLDCGLFQGHKKEAYEINHDFPFDPSEIDAVLLSHAHMDHSGNLPKLIKDGFKGKIFTTPATIDLCKIMLRDSAYLQQLEIDWINNIRRKNNQKPLQVLYDDKDVDICISHFEPIKYDVEFEIFEGIKVTYRDAGHILGSAGIVIEADDKGTTKRLGYSGDIGVAGKPILRDPNLPRALDALIMECTYGNRHHNPYENVEDELAETICEVTSKGGKLIIPAFAVGRTQLLVYIMHKLYDQGRIPDIPIFVDSPLARKATEIYRKHPHIMDRETQRVFLEDEEDPFTFNRLTYVDTAEESKALNNLSYPHVVISSSGMAEGGRILHHLKSGLTDRKNMVLFVGYAAKHTLARKIMDGETLVKIMREEVQVKCQVKTIDGFSGHADRKALINYVNMSEPSKLKNIFLVHGEPEQAESFIDALRSQGYENVTYADLKKTYTI
ncbi:MAG: MBL fold metallo-hydrolase [Fibrobacterales bacterium]